MRLIDADELIEKMYPFVSFGSVDYSELKMVVKSMTTIQPEPQWTPCSEGLPKAKQKVLVQYADGSMATKRCNDEGHLQWFYANAVAWMPAPELWEGDAE